MDRWKLSKNGFCDCEMERDDDGDYVLVDDIEEQVKEIDNVAVEVDRLIEQIPDNHRNKFLIANQCMKLQGICKKLGHFYIE